nr:MAG TPA: hypothetical protein [Caudoviricetes sp.]
MALKKFKFVCFFLYFNYRLLFEIVKLFFKIFLKKFKVYN